MLGDADIVPTLAVKDINQAKEFYGGTLGLTQLDENPGGVRYKCGNGELFIYPSQYAGTNKATAAGFHVADVKATVAQLETKGVTFEQYDMPGMTRDGAVHSMDGFNTAWFKDPDGNILALDDMQG